MALTSCKECGKEVAGTAKTCPHCGVAYPAIKDMRRAYAGGFFVLGLVWMFLSERAAGKEGLVMAWDMGGWWMVCGSVILYLYVEIERNLKERAAGPRKPMSALEKLAVGIAVALVAVVLFGAYLVNAAK